jgi:hypothetical protein
MREQEMIEKLKDKPLTIAIVFVGLAILISGYWVSEAIKFLAYQMQH